MHVEKNSDIQIRKNKNINYLYRSGKQIKFRPWLSNLFAFLYDWIMAKSVLPKKLNASPEKHESYIKKELKKIFEQQGFYFNPLNYENGTILYFKAVKQ
jgi:hypothetical protein